jgi:putative membrane protein
MPIPPTSTSKYGFWALNGLLGLAFVAEFFVPPSVALDGLLIVLAAGASVVGHDRQLPLQNALSAALICAAVGGLAHGLSAQRDLALPFGPVLFNPAAGWKILNFVPWTIPLLWIIALFNARGLARLILRPWRKIKTYGFWLIGLTAVLAMAFDLALEPYAWHVKNFWLWQPTKLPLTWQGATLLNFLGWVCVSLLILVFITPLLIRKQPGQRSTPNLHPLILWLGALGLFAAGSAGAGLWWPVGVDAALAAVTGWLAIRGAKW